MWLLGVVWLAPLVRRRVFDFGVCFGVRLLGLVGFGSCSAHGITCSLAHAHALSLVCAIRSSSVGAAPWLLAGSQGVSAARLCCVFVCLCAWECGVAWCDFFLYCCGSRSAVPCLCWAVWALFLAWCWCRLLARVMLCVRGRLVRRSWVAVAWLCALCRAWVCGWGAFVVARCSVACAACEETGV